MNYIPLLFIIWTMHATLLCQIGFHKLIADDPEEPNKTHYLLEYDRI